MNIKRIITKHAVAGSRKARFFHDKAADFVFLREERKSNRPVLNNLIAHKFVQFFSYKKDLDKKIITSPLSSKNLRKQVKTWRKK
ncbi:MAG: hypothetical protein HY730_10115 [Candidatus Tectomicrobia bacterium]|uniref:Uncharacterized protein n=1 Tax=Tectimicrobiota bacterium TaxID=2528274 RepID=A0A933GPZ8_UNCTE|nr:hypothetical protein [Candidatus Tectomicrobia bacterium]